MTGNLRRRSGWVTFAGSCPTVRPLDCLVIYGLLTEPESFDP
jgi:hypothetical protein